MTTQEFKKATFNRLSKLDVKGLKEVLVFCSDKYEEHFNIINDVAIDLLSDRMTEEEFISFCNEY